MVKTMGLHNAIIMTKEELEELDDEKVFDLWNDYCENNNMFDDTIYHMDEIDDILGKMYPTDLFDTIDFNRFNECDSYFGYNGYGYIESFDTPYDVIDVEALVEYLNEDVI